MQAHVSNINTFISAPTHTCVLLLCFYMHTHTYTHTHAADGLCLVSLQGDLSTVYASGQRYMSSKRRGRVKEEWKTRGILSIHLGKKILTEKALG